MVKQKRRRKKKRKELRKRVDELAKLKKRLAHVEKAETRDNGGRGRKKERV